MDATERCKPPTDSSNEQQDSISEVTAQIRLAPSSIRFTQDSVASRFADGTYLSDTFEDLFSGTKKSDDFEDMEVVESGGIWWALTGNRRLYIYRKLEKLKVISDVSVRVRDLSEPGVEAQLERRMTTSTQGLKAVCRQPENATAMVQITQKWNKCMRKQRQKQQQRQRKLEEENRQRQAAEELMEQERRRL